nr:ribonuclease H-like domain-containing protein [Tanacetum cinerariifolium]
MITTLSLAYTTNTTVSGSSEQLGIDCDETFSLVVKLATIRTALSLTLTRHWHVHQLDVKNTYPYGDLSETAHMHQHPGFKDPRYPHHATTHSSRSSAKAEYRALLMLLLGAHGYAIFFEDYTYQYRPLLDLVYCDNVSIVYLSVNRVQNQQTKHVEIDIHFVRDMVSTGHVLALHVLYRYQYADIFSQVPTGGYVVPTGRVIVPTG